MIFTMSRLWLLSVFTIFICYCYANSFIPSSSVSGDYGPYIVEFYNYGLCKGPKQRDVANCSSTIAQFDGHYKAVINITMFGPTSIDEAKITVYSLKANRRSLIWNQNMPKPCNHFVVASLIAQFVKNDKCLGKKETYSVELDFTEISYTFFGTSFFYGDYFIKALVQSKKGNILCLSLNVVFAKKT